MFGRHKPYRYRDPEEDSNQRASQKEFGQVSQGIAEALDVMGETLRDRFDIRTNRLGEMVISSELQKPGKE